ncbi:hypothetical protein BH18GEM1_BH18GEM1_10910 [soil metagenome]
MPPTTAFIDANVFLCAVGGEHPFRDHSLVATTGVEVLQEILRILHRRGRTGEGVELCRNLLSLFPNMLAVTPGEIATAGELLEHDPDSHFDRRAVRSRIVAGMPRQAEKSRAVEFLKQVSREEGPEDRNSR